MRVNASNAAALTISTAYPGHSDPKLEKDLVVNLGSRLHPEYYPMSVCHIVKGQNYRPKLRGELTSQMIVQAQVPPDRSCAYITEEAFKVIGFDPRAQTAQLLDPDLTLASTKGRILLPPVVSYHEKTASVSNGTWNVNDKGRYSRGGAAAKWAVLPIGDISEHWATWKSFFQRLHGLMNRRGFVHSNQAPTFLTAAPGPGEGLSREGLRTNFTKLRREGYSLLFVLLPNEQAEPYNMVKAASDIDVGIHTVCIARSKITTEKRKDPRDPTGYRYDGQYWDNILLKANLKRGGINHTLSFPTSTILSHWNATVVGLDVTHPPPGAGAQSKSIVGMVASVGRDLAQWPATICFQPREDMEIVTNMQCFRDLLEPHLRRYKKHNTKYPDVLIVYRDGVSEGQYNHVIDLEKPQIQTVCEEVYRADNRPPPKLSIIVVGKRHHTRFFTDEKKQNPVPGTVVDRPITHNHRWEFYLQAHKPIRGTARPAHYVVVHDEFFGPTFNNPENKANRARLGQPNHPALQNAADVLESFTHTMSYALGRSTRSIGVCTPARLADKVCDRARCYVNAGLKEPEIHIADAVKDTMFYI
ncbi:hypothetical protein VTK73DRAFT_4186 [Phialemonium thermophilum]|uniref:Piwi domain-containing protein n=1 Tax=Phialemonium thermophilum TaxID=223376 RepID=A0ABR3WV96_9PEZI